MTKLIKKSSLVDTESAKLIENTIFWFEERIELLKDIVESTGHVVLASSSGEDTELNDEQSSAFRAAISTAISIFGEFPLSLERSATPIDLDDLEA